MIPPNVLARRSGTPIARRYVHGYMTSGYPNGGSSLMDLYLVRYQDGRRKVTYWMHRYAEWAAAGSKLKDSWKTYTDKTLPSGLRCLRGAGFPWLPFES